MTRTPQRQLTPLGKARSNWGFSASKMARLADMAITTVNRLEDGERIGRTTASKYFEVLGFDLDRLVRGEFEQGSRRLDITIEDEGAFIRVAQ